MRSRRATAKMHRMALSPADLDELRALLGEDGVMASDAARFAYEADAMMHARHRPDAIVLPRTTDEVAAIVRWAAARGLPVTPRGAMRPSSDVT